MTSVSSAVEIAPLSAAAVDSWAEAVVAVYRQAFSPPPYSRTEAQVAAFAATLRTHVRRDGFRGLAAFGDGEMIGFTYGHPSRRGQWWHDQVHSALGDDAGRWLDGAFAYVELAVVPTRQQRGTGRRLHDELLAGQPLRRSVLSTLDADTAGRRLYLAAGWRVIHTGFRFARSATPYVIMALNLDELTPGGTLR